MTSTGAPPRKKQKQEDASPSTLPPPESEETVSQYVARTGFYEACAKADPSKRKVLATTLAAMLQGRIDWGDVVVALTDKGDDRWSSFAFAPPDVRRTASQRFRDALKAYTNVRKHNGGAAYLVKCFQSSVRPERVLRKGAERLKIASPRKLVGGKETRSNVIHFVLGESGIGKTHHAICDAPCQRDSLTVVIYITALQLEELRPPNERSVEPALLALFGKVINHVLEPTSKPDAVVDLKADSPHWKVENGPIEGVVPYLVVDEASSDSKLTRSLVRVTTTDAFRAEVAKYYFKEGLHVTAAGTELSPLPLRNGSFPEQMIMHRIAALDGSAALQHIGSRGEGASLARSSLLVALAQNARCLWLLRDVFNAIPDQVTSQLATRPTPTLEAEMLAGRIVHTIAPFLAVQVTWHYKSLNRLNTVHPDVLPLIVATALAAVRFPLDCVGEDGYASLMLVDERLCEATSKAPLSDEKFVVWRVVDPKTGAPLNCYFRRRRSLSRLGAFSMTTAQAIMLPIMLGLDMPQDWSASGAELEAIVATFWLLELTAANGCVACTETERSSATVAAAFKKALGKRVPKGPGSVGEALITSEFVVPITLGARIETRKCRTTAAVVANVDEAELEPYRGMHQQRGGALVMRNAAAAGYADVIVVVNNIIFLVHCKQFTQAEMTAGMYEEELMKIGFLPFNAKKRRLPAGIESGEHYDVSGQQYWGETSLKTEDNEVVPVTRPSSVSVFGKAVTQKLVNIFGSKFVVPVFVFAKADAPLAPDVQGAWGWDGPPLVLSVGDHDLYPLSLITPAARR